jgi:cytidylate kinase
MGIVITLSGQHGTGKSTYARQIASKLNLRYVSAGSLFREVASERGLSLMELGRMCEEDEGIDKMIDGRSIESMRGGNVLIDSQLAGHFARDLDALKICLTALLDIRVDRIAKRDKKPSREMRDETLERDLSIYDLVLNTALMPLEANLSILEHASREYIGSRR